MTVCVLARARAYGLCHGRVDGPVPLCLMHARDFRAAVGFFRRMDEAHRVEWYLDRIDSITAARKHLRDDGDREQYTRP